MTTPTPALPAAAPLSTLDQLNATLASQKQKVASLNLQLQVAQRLLSSQKTSSGKTSAQARVNSLQSQITASNNSLNTTQNNIYSTTGQYDKLLSGTSRDAYLALNTLFSGYGLGSLAGNIFNYVKNGYSSATISILLQVTPTSQPRLPANIPPH